MRATFTALFCCLWFDQYCYCLLGYDSVRSGRNVPTFRTRLHGVTSVVMTSYLKALVCVCVYVVCGVCVCGVCVWCVCVCGVCGVCVCVWCVCGVCVCVWCVCVYIYFFLSGAATQRGSWPPHSRGFLDHTQRRTTVGRNPLDEWSARSRDLYLTAHTTHNRQTSMPPVEFEHMISAGERPQNYALDRAATGTGA